MNTSKTDPLESLKTFKNSQKASLQPNEENVPIDLSELEEHNLQCEQSEDNSADVSFQATAPKIELNFPRDSCHKKSYLHTAEIERVEELTPACEIMPEETDSIKEKFNKVAQAIEREKIFWRKPNGHSASEYVRVPENPALEIRKLKAELEVKDKKLKEAYKFIETILQELTKLKEEV